MRTILTALILGGSLLLVSSCVTFDGPPEVRIEGSLNGILPDAASPITLSFSKPFREGTLAFEIVPLTLDEEGKLSDEVPGGAELRPIIRYEASGLVSGGRVAVDAGKGRVTIQSSATMPVGQKLALLIEPGLQNLAGVATTVRERVGFAFDFTCARKPITTFPSGAYFFALDVDQPIAGTQIQLFGDFAVDETTGEFRAQFTNADRNPDRSRCKSVSCSAADACRTLPTEACVLPSQKISSVDEFPDFVANAEPPTGYGVLVDGCIQEQPDGAVALATRSVDLNVARPAVTVQGLTIVMSFKKDSANVLRGTGGGRGVQILLTDNKSAGPAVGTVRARSLTPEEVPAGVPRVPRR